MTTKLKRIQAIIVNPFADVELKPRERWIVRLSSRGVPPPDIAAELDMTRQNVYKSLAKSCVKIGEKRDRIVSFKDLTRLILEDIQKVINS